MSRPDKVQRGRFPFQERMPLSLLEVEASFISPVGPPGDSLERRGEVASIFRQTTLDKSTIPLRTGKYDFGAVAGLVAAVNGSC